MPVQIRVAEKLVPLLTKPKRLKVAVGGRGGSKSIAFADAFLRFCDAGERLCCAREFQNSIDDSVHSLLKSRIEALDVETLASDATRVYSDAGGEIFYRGLARNLESIKSMFGVKRIWIEEARTLSNESLEVLLPTIREEGSELWFSMNRGSSKDPVSQKLLKPYERELERTGFYEDDDIIIVQINWDENPFFPDVLNKERLRDKKYLSAAKYAHIWEGAYSDTVENAIIEPEWFDACIDAHIALKFKPEGLETITFDPFDGGEDAAGLVYQHGSVILDAQETREGRVNDVCDWALDYAIQRKPDVFIWDAGGIGAGLKRQITDALGPKKISIQMFEGQGKIDMPDAVYEPTPGTVMQAKTNKDVYFNRRAQRYWELRDRIFRTYLAVRDGTYTDPSKLISFSSDIKILPTMRAELCRIPRKPNGQGKIQILSKPEMKKEGIDSPNVGDCVMMLGDAKVPMAAPVNIDFTGWNG